MAAPSYGGSEPTNRQEMFYGRINDIRTSLIIGGRVQIYRHIT